MGILSEDSQGSKSRIALIFDSGSFYLASAEESKKLSSVDISPAVGVSGLCEILIEALLSLSTLMKDGFNRLTLNQEPKFLDFEKANELGNSISVKVGPRGGEFFVSEPWVNYIEAVLTEILNLQRDIVSGSAINNPPYMIEEDANETIKSLHDEIRTLNESLSNLRGVSDNLIIANKRLTKLKKEVQLRDTKCKNLKTELQQRSHPKSKDKQRSNDFVRRDNRKHKDQHEIDRLLYTFILKKLGKSER